MSAELFQFPNKYHTPVHAIRNGEPWWVYKAEYSFNGEKEIFYFWARNEGEAKARLATLASSCTYVGRLKDIMEASGELQPPPPKKV